MAASLLASIELTLHQFGQTLQACHARVRMRRRLSQLDERALHQFGLSRAEVLKELKKPFWVA
ncbi:MAG: DUF1127 domain-containing protein [Azospirillum sp.]|nr:DUF1127 domain-containing protein [Azospirillum sp.]